MHKLLLAILLLFPLASNAQFMPKEGAALNYRLIGFSIPGTTGGTLQVAKGHYNNADSFEKNIVVSQACKTGKTIAEVPAFGAPYTWRIKEDKKNGLHHFTTLAYHNGEHATSRFRIINNSGKHTGSYVFVDRSMTLYNMNGEPVWFIPGMEASSGNKGGLRDVKLTPQGTVTFVVNDDVREIDYNASTLWRGPNDGKVSGDTSELYHHEFTRLKNGHYMALGTEHPALPLAPQYQPQSTDSTMHIFKDAGGNFRQKLEFGTVIEYDSKGRVVWSWKSSDYFRKSEIFDHYKPDGSLPLIDVHANAFHFDEQKKVLYVGFKNISRIVKLKYPEGKVIAVYGNRNDAGSHMMCSDDFCGQHNIRLSSAGELMVFNNNSATFANMPQVLLFKEKEDNSGLQKIWSYECTLDGVDEKEIALLYKKDEQMRGIYPPDKLRDLAMNVSPGGNFIELPGRCFFVSMSGQFAKMFILTEQKEILWSAILEIRIFDGAPWTTPGSYRASIITRTDLEKFIWNSK